MPTHSKAIAQYQTQHAVSEALGFIGITLYVGILAGIVYQLGSIAGLIG